ncbi:hypothetical protein ACHAWC_006130, partial [Mediolabrus comicus]
MFTDDNDAAIWNGAFYGATNKTTNASEEILMIDLKYEDLSGGFENHPHMPALDENGKPGYVHDVKALRRNPPKFDFQESEAKCEHNDATMQLLTQKVHVDFDADKHANKLAQEGVKPPRAKIFCHVYTTQNNHDRIRTIRETWGQRCDGFLAGSTVTDKSVDSVNIPHEGKEVYGNMWQKVRTMWSYVYDNYYEEYDWFHIGGDDMYVLVENLRLYLESEEIQLASSGGRMPKTSSKKQHPLIIGSIFRRDGEEDKLFLTGGGGYTLNKAALKVLVMSFETCAPHEVTSAEDFMVSKCLNDQGIQLFDAKDENGADRYHHNSPEFVFNFDPKKDPLYWYSYFSTNTNGGANHTATRPVSFHMKQLAEKKNPTQSWFRSIERQLQNKAEVINRIVGRRHNPIQKGRRISIDPKGSIKEMKRVHAILYGYCTNVTLGPEVATTGWHEGRMTFWYWKSPPRECELNKKADEICNCSLKTVRKQEKWVC